MGVVWIMFGERSRHGVAAAHFSVGSGMYATAVALTQCCVLSKVLAVSVGQY